MKYLLLLSAILLVGVNQTATPDLNQAVTYRTVAIPASKAIEDLAKATHVDLGVTAPLDSQPLIISVKDVPLKDLMDRIATVLHGRWSQNKTAYTLQRPDDLTAQLRQADFQERLNLIQKYWTSSLADRPTTALDDATAEAILRRVKKLQAAEQASQEEPTKQPTDEEMKAEEAKEEAMQKQSALDYRLSAQGRLTFRIYQGIAPSALAASSPNQQMVFSTDPKPLQYKLQMSAEDMQDLVQEQNLWTTADKRVNPDKYANDPPGSDPRHLIDINDARVVAIVQPDDKGLPGQIQGYVLDSKGRAMVDSQGPGEVSGDFNSSTSDEAPSFSKWKLPTVPLSPLAREFMSLAIGRRNIGVGEMRPASPDLHSFLLDAVDRDPLSLHVSEVLLTCADAKSWNLVASPTDSMADCSAYTQADRIDGAELLTQASFGAGCTVLQDGTWLTLQPTHPLDAEAKRTDRASLSAALKSIDDQGYASIDGMSTFAAENGANVDVTLASQYIGLCYPELRPFEDMPLTDLRLYGILSDDQRRALFQGSRISMNELSTEQQAAMFAEIQNPSLMVGAAQTGFVGANDDHDLSSMMSDDFDRGEPIWSSHTEPTPPSEDAAAQTQDDEADFFYEKPLDWSYSEILGIDPSATLSLTFAKAEGDEISERDLPKIAADGQGGYDGPRPSQQWTSARSVAAELVRPSGDLISYASCPTYCVQIQVKVVSKFTVIENLMEHGKGMTAFGTVENLPERVRLQIQKEAKRVRSASPTDGSDQPQAPADQKPPPPARR